jgi:hypothetical protein
MSKPRGDSKSSSPDVNNSTGSARGRPDEIGATKGQQARPKQSGMNQSRQSGDGTSSPKDRNQPAVS